MSEELKHQLILNERKELEICGVTLASSATENSVCLETVMGGMMIKGKQMHVDKLDTESGNIIISGEICEVKYVPAKKPFIKRLFK